uniref:Peptidase S1 domain-containing protein n=1 Tax=Varanus komodoensis TaxID=61221 RepID=A0A8D2IUT9_VARKO
MVYMIPLKLIRMAFSTGQSAGETTDEKEEIFPASRPFMVALFRKKHLFCGGTLIKKDWVLTAAHCFPNEYTRVILGAYSRTKKEDGKHKANISKTFSYPGFNPRIFENDIMLLQIHTKGHIHEPTNTIPLSKKSDDIKEGTQCLIAGWGTINKRKGSDKLREVNVTVMNRDMCNNKKHYNSVPHVTMNMVCAGEKKTGKDMCWGDSGSPLICNGEQRGILAFVKNCGNSRYPGVYMRFTKEHLSWINQTLKDHSTK